MNASVMIHGFPASTYTRSARIGAIESSIDHELVPLAYGEPEHFALHPFGKMPVLQDGDITVFETLAILRYLDMRYGSNKLFGGEPRQQIAVLRAASVAVDYAYQPVVHLEVSDGEPEPNAYRLACRVLDWLELQASAATFISGTSLSAADVMLAPMVAHHAAKVGNEVTYAERPDLRRWMGEMSSRASWAATEA